MDFDENEWKQTSNNPVIFEAIKNNVNLEIEDTSHKAYKIKFKKGGKLHMFKIIGKFRLTWDDGDILLPHKMKYD